MKKFKFFLIIMLLMSTTILSSCDMLMGDTHLMNKKLEKFVECINSNNAEEFKSLFSEETIKKYDSFDNDILTLFDFIDGEIISWEDKGGLGSSDGFNDDGSGLVWKEISAIYDIKTSNQTYHLALKVATKHSKDSQKIGVNSFHIINSKDWSEDFYYGGSMHTQDNFFAFGIIIDNEKTAKEIVEAIDKKRAEIFKDFPSM